ncbi:hypothetical protein [Streptomyces sp. TE33382]
MGSRTPHGTTGARHPDELAAAVTITTSQLAQPVGRFHGDKAAMVLTAVRTPERVLSELDTCDDVIDEALGRRPEHR